MCLCKKDYLCIKQNVLSLSASWVDGGKSGQHRASCFLTGRRRQPATASATENIPPASWRVRVKT
jgi:hypothetical protein